MAVNPRSRSARISGSKPVASAHAPWTRTIVGIALVTVTTASSRNGSPTRHTTRLPAYTDEPEGDRHRNPQPPDPWRPRASDTPGRFTIANGGAVACVTSHRACGTPCGGDTRPYSG